MQKLTTLGMRKFRRVCWDIFTGYPKGTPACDRIVSLSAIHAAMPEASIDALRVAYLEYCKDTNRIPVF